MRSGKENDCALNAATAPKYDFYQVLKEFISDQEATVAKCQESIRQHAKEQKKPQTSTRNQRVPATGRFASGPRNPFLQRPEANPQKLLAKAEVALTRALEQEKRARALKNGQEELEKAQKHQLLANLKVRLAEERQKTREREAERDKVAEEVAERRKYLEELDENLLEGRKRLETAVREYETLRHQREELQASNQAKQGLLQQTKDSILHMKERIE